MRVESLNGVALKPLTVSILVETTPAGGAKSRADGGSGCSSERRLRVSETIWVGTMLPVLLITALPSKFPAHAPTVNRAVAPTHQRLVNSLDVPDLNIEGTSVRK